MLETGIKKTIEITVTEDMTAQSAGSGTLKVFGTPYMIALIEETAWTSIAPHLEEGQGTVGISLNIEHIAPTPVGMRVKCETTLTAIDGRKLSFEAEVYDEKGLIGKGTHERFIVYNEKFQSKADAKLNA